MTEDPDHIVVSYSGGIASFAAAARCVETYGADRVTLVFADTLIEDEDLYRFLRQGAEALGSDLVWLQDGRTPWDVFRDERYIGNSRKAPCSRVLKTRQVKRWLDDTCDPDRTALAAGLSLDEYERLPRMAAKYPKWRVTAPLCWRPAWTRPDIWSALERYDLAAPRLYAMGFPHNNCGGFCVRSGQEQFAHLYRHFPDRYLWHESEMERVQAEIPGARPFLREQRAGELRYLTLREWRERLEAAPGLALEGATSQPGCGCFIDDDEDEA